MLFMNFEVLISSSEQLNIKFKVFNHQIGGGDFDDAGGAEL